MSDTHIYIIIYIYIEWASARVPPIPIFGPLHLSGVGCVGGLGGGGGPTVESPEFKGDFTNKKRGLQEIILES